MRTWWCNWTCWTSLEGAGCWYSTKSRRKGFFLFLGSFTLSAGRGEPQLRRDPCLYCEKAWPSLSVRLCLSLQFSLSRPLQEELRLSYLEPGVEYCVVASVGTSFSPSGVPSRPHCAFTSTPPSQRTSFVHLQLSVADLSQGRHHQAGQPGSGPGAPSWGGPPDNGWLCSQISGSPSVWISPVPQPVCVWEERTLQRAILSHLTLIYKTKLIFLTIRQIHKIFLKIK